MNISDICRHGIVSVDSRASPRMAAEAMRSHHVGTVVVTVADGDVGRAAGLLTDRDLAVEVLARGLDADNITVGVIASTELVSVPGSLGIAEAVAAMRRQGVRRLLVTGLQGEIIGIVSADDLLEAMTTQLAGLSAALREGMAREAERRPAVPAVAAHPVFLPYGTPGLQKPTGRF